MAKKVIVFDAGHGGTDSGSIWNNGFPEKNYNLNMSLAVAEHLGTANITCFLNRITDITLDQDDRIKYLNEFSCKNDLVDVYSFHTNAFDKKTEGVEILLSQSNTVDEEWSKAFLSEYCKQFKFVNRGIVRRKKDNGDDYYFLHRLTEKNVKVKIIEFGFGDKLTDMVKLINNFEAIAFFTAQQIAYRYGKVLKKPDKRKTYTEILKEFDVENLTLPQLIEKLYYTIP